ncbi:hypothetical protein F4861DRAFT_445652 [Xylaria intraflava]|nr:hypothetical protein F4861DRAFT_445652 [Xylaria intraflava]
MTEASDWASNATLPPPPPPPARSTSIAFIQSRFRRLTTFSSHKSTSHSTEDIRGPLGLNVLYEPSEPLVDFIFVHGLNGGSRKTWSYSEDPAMFWPKEWLPSEPGFKHVRIQSYGYSSDWSRRQQSKLTIHDFGQALLADIHNSPLLRKSGDTPIVFIAHSMGGLVVKKAFLLATRDPTYKETANRIHSIYFLASPHRGADSAQLLSRLMSVSGPTTGSKAYANDLVPGNGTLQAINDEFRHISEGVNLWSFFESVPIVNLGIVSFCIVDKESAVMGLPREHVQYLEADHRNVCKFGSPSDPNYLILYNCMTSTIHDIEKNCNSPRNEKQKFQMKNIAKLLGLQWRPATDLLEHAEKQHEGSCEWITDSDEFYEWLNSDYTFHSLATDRRCSEVPQLLWLTGPPGSGKSVATSHVVKYLQACNLDCSFHFFRQRDREKPVLSELLKSLAYQMAESNSEVRRRLHEMLENEGNLTTDDHSTVWNTIFKNCVLETSFSQPQFWVLDSLDECSSKTVSSLVLLLAKAARGAPLRVFLSSRPGGQIETLLHREHLSFLELRTGSKGSLRDIASFVKAKWSYSGAETLNNKLLTEVLRKSNGNFLWASLIMGRLDDAYSVEDMENTLQHVPSEMNEFYTKISDSVAQSPGADLAKCVLKWIICASRPLKMAELKAAIHMDIGRTLAVSDDKLGDLCGHLVMVDKEGCLQVIHQTVTAFLTQQTTELHIDRHSTHSRLAEICLAHLCSKEFAPPRSRRVIRNRKPTTPFSDYACTYFSYHMLHCSSSIDTPLMMLSKFIESNSLGWIEQVTTTGSLVTLTKTVQNLQAYLARREKHRSPLGMEVRMIRSWINDLARIVTAFGPSLLTSPSSIYFLIPPLCPPPSIMHQLFFKPSKQFKLLGSAEKEWDDRISCFVYSVDAVSLASSTNALAVGLSNGEVMVYNSTTFQTVATLAHGERVMFLAYGHTSALLASCGPRKVTLWNSQFCPVWSRNLNDIALTLSFSSDDSELLVPERNGAVSIFNSKTGVRADRVLLDDHSDSDSDEGNSVRRGPPPSLVRLSPTDNLAAIAYRNSAITIWDMDRNDKVGLFEKEGCEGQHFVPQVMDIVFNPIPDLDLMAVAYKDGEIVLCDPWSLEQRSKYSLLAHTLATSPDGRTLAAGDSIDVIHLFAFETLRLMYRITVAEYGINSIIFASNNIRFFDIRGTCCNVWEPPVLIRRDESDDASSEPQSEEFIPQVPESAITRSFESEETIHAIEHPAGADFVFCGRENGSITIHSLETGVIVKKFQFHYQTFKIRHLKWLPTHDALLSVDTAGRCVVTRILSPPKGQWEEAECLFDHSNSEVIIQALPSPDLSSVLIVSRGVAELRDFRKGVVASHTSAGPSCTWINHPTNAAWLVCLSGNTAQVVDWSSLAVINTVTLAPSTDQNINVNTPTWLVRHGHDLIVRLSWSHNSHDTEIMIVNSRLDSETSEVNATVVTKKLSSPIKALVGLAKSSLYFLDAQGWVCSIGLKGITDAKHYTRHFFIPLTWQTAEEVALSITLRNGVAFAHNDQLVVFHGFLDFEETVFFQEGSEKKQIGWDSRMG